MKQTIRSKLFVWSIIFLSISYILSLKLAIWTIPLVLFTWLLNFKDTNFIGIIKQKKIFVPAVFLLVMAFSLFYSKDLTTGFNKTERFLSFLILPVIFSTQNILKAKNYKFIIKLFTYTVSFVYIVCFLNAIFLQLKYTITKNGPLNWYYFYRFDFLKPFNQHPSYIAMYTILSIAFLLFYPKIFSKKIILIQLFIQLTGFVLTGNRIGIVVLLIMFTWYVLKYYTLKTFVYYTISLILIATLALQVPIIKQRMYMTLGLKYKYTFYYKKHHTDHLKQEGRKEIWQDAFDLFLKKPVFGYGIGDVEKKLIAQYKQNNHLQLYKLGYNTHNSYLQWLLVGGILLFISYIFLILLMVYYGVKEKNYVLIIFSLIVLFFSITETFFRIQGILFIIFWYVFLMSKTFNLEIKPKFQKQ